MSQRRGIARKTFGWAFITTLVGSPPVLAQFRLEPYLQLLSTDAVSIVWLSPNDVAGTLEWGPTTSYGQTLSSVPVAADALTTVVGEVEEPENHPYRHQVRLSGLSTNTTYFYRVSQGSAEHASRLTTAAALETDFTFVVAADPESKATEPLRNQIHRAVLELIETKDPRFLVYAGDLVDQGNAQDDWDAFWSDLVGPSSPSSLASSIPVYPALGNHEYDGLNTTLGGNPVPYAQPFAEDGVWKYRSYFSLPPNNHPALDARHGRYYAVTYGPVSLIVIDTNNDSISTLDPSTNWDSGRFASHPLVGENEPPEPGGQSWAPDIHGGLAGTGDSSQYRWLVAALAKARRESAFVFVVNHQAPYSSFVHGDPDEGQSGHPIRKLDPLFHHFGVDAVFSGHDESYEHSVTTGTRRGGVAGKHEIHYFVIPTIGDPTGLRLPEPDPVWQEGFSRFLYPLDNRRHGFLAVEITHRGGTNYAATLTPYYLDPSDPSNADLFYDDVTVLAGRLDGAVEILGPSELCRGQRPVYRVARGFGSYRWTLDRRPVGGGTRVRLEPPSPGRHVLKVTVTLPGGGTPGDARAFARGSLVLRVAAACRPEIRLRDDLLRPVRRPSRRR